MSRLLVARHAGVDPGGIVIASDVDFSGGGQWACSASRNTPVTDRTKSQLVFIQA